MALQFKHCLELNQALWHIRNKFNKEFYEIHTTNKKGFHIRGTNYDRIDPKIIVELKKFGRKSIINGNPVEQLHDIMNDIRYNEDIIDK